MLFSELYLQEHNIKMIFSRTMLMQAGTIARVDFAFLVNSGHFDLINRSGGLKKSHSRPTLKSVEKNDIRWSIKIMQLVIPWTISLITAFILYI